MSSGSFDDPDILEEPHAFFLENNVIHTIAHEPEHEPELEHPAKKPRLFEDDALDLPEEFRRDPPAPPFPSTGGETDADDYLGRHTHDPSTSGRPKNGSHERNRDNVRAKLVQTIATELARELQAGCFDGVNLKADDIGWLAMGEVLETCVFKIMTESAGTIRLKDNLICKLVWQPDTVDEAELLLGSVPLYAAGDMSRVATDLAALTLASLSFMMLRPLEDAVKLLSSAYRAQKILLATTRVSEYYKSCLVTILDTLDRKPAAEILEMTSTAVKRRGGKKRITASYVADSLVLQLQDKASALGESQCMACRLFGLESFLPFCEHCQQYARHTFCRAEGVSREKGVLAVPEGAFLCSAKCAAAHSCKKE